MPQAPLFQLLDLVNKTIHLVEKGGRCCDPAFEDGVGSFGINRSGEEFFFEELLIQDYLSQEIPRGKIGGMSGDPRLELRTRLIVLEVINVVQDGVQSAGFIRFFSKKESPKQPLGWEATSNAAKASDAKDTFPP
jgi:hypothetical protein